MKSNLFAEIGVSNIPARFVTKINALDIGIEIKTTSKRIILDFSKLDYSLESKREVSGPPTSVSNEVKSKFLSKYSIGESDLFIKKDRGREYYCAFIEEKKSIEDLVEEYIDRVLSIDFDKRMEWSGISFIRPVRYITVFNENKMLSISIGEINSSNFIDIRGEKYTVEGYNQYFDLLSKKGVKLSRDDLISRFGEHSNNFENPKEIICKIPNKFLSLPLEIIRVNVEKHQSGRVISQSEFSVLSEDYNSDEVVRKDNEKAIESRLEDALFFYNQDKEKSMDHFVKESNKISYYEFGTYGDKVDRVSKVIDIYFNKLNLKKDFLKHSNLLKFDLSTSVVREKDYQLLRGYISKEYAIERGLDKSISSILFEHYLPRFSGDGYPSTIEAALVGIVDKMDNIAAASLASTLPTGASDPMHIRREAISIVALVNRFRIDIDLIELYREIAQLYSIRSTKSEYDYSYFMKSRATSYFEDIYDKELVNLFSEEWTNILLMADKLQYFRCVSLESAKKIYTRLNKVLKGEKGRLNGDLLSEQERELLEASLKLKSLPSFKDKTKYLGDLDLLISDFFDKIIILDKDLDKRNNRLYILNEILEDLLTIADFRKMGDR